MSAREVVKLLKIGEVSPSELIDASEQRTEQVDGDVNAMVTKCFDRARNMSGKTLAKAKESAGKEPGWLAGLPIGIKDLSAVSGVRTTFGTPDMADHVPAQNDPIVDTLEARGGLVVGKTNTPEMGAGGNTFNDVFGFTRNPWDTRKNSGGSSGGAAVSLAAGEVWLSHGSDLAGSLRTPAAYCGVVGLRPSPGRAFGGPMALGFSHEGLSGPMARDVLDCALFLDAMCGYDERAPLSLPAPAEPFFTSASRASMPVRVAFAPTLNGFAPVEAEICSVMGAALEKLASEGATIEEACPELPDLYNTYITLRALHWAALPGRAPQSVQSQY
ncbi:MAG: amidase, partial [Rhizobiaceae bacterium]